ncbi:MAG: VanZ family protein [Kiritimatiellia bacterium]
MNITPKQRLLICGIYAAGLFVLSLMPAGAIDEAPELLPHQDKILHALLYGGFAFLLGRALPGFISRRPWVAAAAIVLLAASYGALMEILQGSLPWIERACSWGDMLANIAGAIMGTSLSVLAFRSMTSA